MSRELRTRFSLLQPDREKSEADKQALQKSAHDRRAHSRDWIVGDRVMAHNPRPGPDWVPSTIVEVLGPITYVVETEAGQRWKRHADQLKDWLPSVPATTSGSASEDILDAVSDSEEAPEEPAVDPTDNADPAPTEPHVEDPETPEPLEPRYPRRIRRPPTRYD